MRRAAGTLLIAVFLLTFGSVAHAQRPYFNPPNPNPNPPVVKGTVFEKPISPAVIPQRQTFKLFPTILPSNEQAVLPFTGAELTAYLVMGLGAVGAGSLILRRVRA